MKVFLIASITADGLLARDANDFVMDWTSPEDVKHFVKLTKQAGVMIIGSRTFDTILQAGRRLPGRKVVVYSSRGQAAYPPDIRPDITEVTQEPPVQLIKRLEQEGFPAVAICGGAQIYDLFIKSGLVTDLYLTIEPKVFGNGIRLLSSGVNIDLKLITCDKLNDNTLALHYQVV